MSLPTLPKRSIKLYTGADPGQLPLQATFNRRLDVIVPANTEGSRLGAQTTTYAIASGVRLKDLFEEEFRPISDLRAVTLGDEGDGAWFIDGQRGKLVLKVAKTQYESLGIVGNEKQGAYIIEVDLQDKTSKAYARAKESFEKWDETWNVWYTAKNNVFGGSSKVQVTPKSVLLEHVLVPTSLPVEQEEDELWIELFEWVGLCSLGARGSPRIRSQDQVNSYIARYSPPEGSRVASVVRFRWEGLLSEAFIRDTIRIAREEALDALVAFSVSSVAHVPAPFSTSRCETRAGVGVSGDWALAEMMAPI